MKLTPLPEKTTLKKTSLTGVNVILQHYFWINHRFIFVFWKNDISYEPMNVFSLTNVNEEPPFL